MKRDNSPVKPTCPEINNASSTIVSIETNLSEQIVELRALGEGLENLRTENSDLRTWGNEQYDRAEELEQELESAKAEIQQLKYDIKEMDADLKKLDELNMKLITEQA